MPFTFTARYASTCAANCGITIMRGDEICWAGADDRVAHVDCRGAAEREGEQ